MPKSNKGSTEKTRKIYLDYASSVESNPSSIHMEGVQARVRLQNARREVAGVLGAKSEEIIFTSGGTESNNLAIQGMVLSLQGKMLPHIITTNIEHPSVLETFKLLEKRKLAQISIVPVEANGIVDPKKIKKEIKKNTVLVSVMYANNEIGTIQPIREIAKEIRHFRKQKEKKKGFLRSSVPWVPPPARPFQNLSSFPFFHTDAVQAGNYLDLNVERLGVDLLSLSGSKIFGGGKVGVLYKKKSVPLANIFGGGNQEMGLRPGTENLPEILKFSKALQFTQKVKEKEAKRLTKLRDYFIASLHQIFSSCVLLGLPSGTLGNKKFDEASLFVNGDLKDRLPNNINITIPNIPSDLLVIELSAKGIMCSSKSACESGDGKASYVIKAINKNISEEDGSLRFSLGRDTTKADIDYTVKALSQILTKLEKWYTR
ncbi:MAG: cysteine desulfurase family protein [Candidatus Paceibacterota bacterium]|jgi:cysteine desulfurase